MRFRIGSPGIQQNHTPRKISFRIKMQRDSTFKLELSSSVTLIALEVAERAQGVSGMCQVLFYCGF
jgi:hypothetical protein